VDPARVERSYAGANQGALLIALDPGCFLPREAFFREMAEFVERVGRLEPMPGYQAAHLPGGPEWLRERLWADVGPPIGEQHREQLEAVGRELGVDPGLLTGPTET
jgi:LDH2 family malate/lactate/ureidoglycolate dehydrogenase